MFEFKYFINTQLPQLSWVAKVHKYSNTVDVHCGKGVECTSEYFVAGVWDGDFDKANFDSSSFFCGTGAKIEAGNIIFVTPSHALERIVMYEDENYFSFSNSLSLLMAFEKLNLDVCINQYESILCSILKGPKKMCSEIPMKGTIIQQFIVSVIVIDINHGIYTKQRKKSSAFVSYDDYYTRIVEMLHNLKDNATSEKRKTIKYGSVATLSTGYDSTACACLAYEIGCKKAVTLAGAKYVADDGTAIGKQIGFDEVVKRESSLYREKSGLIDAEYISSGEMGTMLQFSVFEDVFMHSLVFYGVRGTYWSKDFNVTEEYEMKGYYLYETDISWTENALKNGYINIPLPAYCADVCNSIKAISNSEEMKKWSVGGMYDKPIPRRIAENFGVQRTSFGMTKKGGGSYLGYDNIATLSNKLSKEGYFSFRKYVSTNRFPLSIKKIKDIVKYHYKIMPTYLDVIMRKIGFRETRIHQKPTTMSNPLTASKLFFWSIDVMKKKYEDSLNN